MDFSVTHTFTAPPARVMGVLCDVDFHLHLELPDLSLPEVVSQETDGSRHNIRLRYEFVGHVDPIVTKVMRGKQLAWVQDLVVDTDQATGSLSYSAEALGSRFAGDANITFTSLDDGGTRRDIAGKFQIKIPLVGGRAEHAIVPGVTRRLDIEAEAVAARLADGS